MAGFSALLKSTRTHLFVVLAILLLGFGADVVTPRGFTDWVFYLLAVLLAMRIPGRFSLRLVAVIASGFTVVGLLLSPAGQPFWISAVSRSMALILIWTEVAIALRWRRADEKLRRLDQAVSGSGEIVFMTDPEGIITSINPAFTENYGYTAEEVVGKTTPRILKSGRIAPETYKTFWEMLQAKRQVQGEFVNKTKDGRFLTVEGSASAILDRRGRITGFLAIHRDITERKNADEALRKSEASLSAAQRIAHVGNWDWHIVHDRAWWSAEMYRIFGVDPSGPVPTLDSSLKLMHPDDRPSVEAALKGSLENGSPYEVDYRIVRPDGVERAVHAQGEVVLNADHKPVHMVGIVQDITERNRAEERMRNLERRFSLAFNAGPEPMTISKLSNSVYVDVNEAFLRITGYRREEILGQSSLALKFWASPERRHALLDKLRKGPAQDFEITFMTKSGERRSGLLSAQTIEVDGQPCLLAVTKDITERKQAEEELKRLNRDLRTICECNQALVRASEEPELLKRICEILVDHGKFRMAWVGYAEQDEAKRVPPVAFAGEEAGYLSTLKITWADAPLGHGPTGTCIRNRQPALARYIRHDPSMAPWREEALKRGFESSIGLPLIAAGKTLGALTLYSPKADAFDAQEVNLLRELADDLAFGIAALRVRDERERAEQALRKSEDRYRDLVEHSRDLICTHDLEGRLLSVNPEPARILGYSTEELLSTWLRDLLAPEARSQFDAYLERIQRQGEDQGILRVRCRDGRQRIWEYHNTLRTEGLTRPIVRGLAHDITDRLEAEKALKKTQEQFLQAQKMEAVGRLAGGVAHDFNNLLTVINGYSDLLLAQAAEGSDERARLEEIKKAGDRAAALTRQLLAFSRKQVVMPAVLDLNLIVEGMEKMLRRLIGEDIEFVENLSPSLGRVRADAGQIEQVIMNLAVNARDAMPKGGKLTIEATNVQLGEEHTKDFLPLTPGSYVLLAISDTGCGMDAETQSHIFEPFFTTKGQGTGTGLGLSTAYGIVKQSGGIINVYSEVGRGTTFKVYLKRVGEPTAEGLKTEEDVVPSEGTETVLLVEDEPAVRSLAQMTLQAKGYTVLVAGEYIEAMTLARQHAGNIHLLLTDVIMPGLNGRELADLLLALRPTMKVLFISGYTADAIAQHGILDEGVAFLPKPFTPRDLLRRVRQILDAVKP